MSTISERVRAQSQSQVARAWEEKFSRWARPPGQTERDRCENAVKVVRNAIASSDKLKNKAIKVFTQGSFRNRVNVRQDSDVDVGVMLHDVFIADYPPGKGHGDYGNTSSTYTYREFKDDLETALVGYLGRRAVKRGNKAIDVSENSYHVEVDVVPFFEYRHHFENGAERRGVVMFPDRGGGRIENYPERLLDSWPRRDLHYENGVTKNSTTGRSYKSVVRILKTLRNDMGKAGDQCAVPIPGFLLECMTWNAPDYCFLPSSWYARTRAVLAFLATSTDTDEKVREWTEVSNVKYLFRRSQPWTREQANAFALAAWGRIGVRP
jgi:hypothetical protein